MVDGEVEHSYWTALAPVDLSKLSVKAIKTGMPWVCRMETGPRSFMPLGKRRMFHAGLSSHVIDRYVAEERVRPTNELARFLKANGLDDHGQPVRVVVEGPRSS